MDFFKNKENKDKELIANANHYFLYFFSGNTEIDEKWDDFYFRSPVNLGKDDFINFRSYTASFADELFQDYGTKKFIIISKEFIIDDNILDQGGVVCLNIKPYIDK